MNAHAKIEQTLHSAMAAAFGEIEAATKSAPGQIGQQKYKYADLGSVIDAIKPALIQHGLFFTQHPEPTDHGICIETLLHHSGGESLSLGKLFVPANKQDAQGFGSALTYARRYGLQTAFGVPTEDDDGNAAVRGGQSQRGAVSPPQTLSDEQVVRLQSLIQATSSNVNAYCKRLNVTTLDQIPAAQFKDALALLENKLADMAKADTNAQAKEDA